jgi:hypothetical protein
MRACSSLSDQVDYSTKGEEAKIKKDDSLIVISEENDHVFQEAFQQFRQEGSG